MTAHDVVGLLARRAFRGTVTGPQDAKYDEARQVWNGLIDRRPAVVCACVDVGDVVAAVEVARETGLQVSIRAGRHQVGGGAVLDDAMVVDVAAIRHVEIDGRRETVRVGGGACWSHLLGGCVDHGVGVASGDHMRTGVVGVALGGGIGPFMRSMGLTCDALRAVELVLADGSIERIDDTHRPDVMWACRGFGRGFGVVTELDFDLSPMARRVPTAQMIYGYDSASEVLHRWRDLVPTLHHTVTAQLQLCNLPERGALPAALRGRRVVVVAGVVPQPSPEADEALRPLRLLAPEPLLDLSRDVDVTEETPDHGRTRSFMKSHFVDVLGDAMIDELLECDQDAPDGESSVVLRTMGGKIASVNESSSSFPHRSSGFNLNVRSTWVDPAEDVTRTEWCRSTWDRTRPHANGGVYLNFSGLEGDLAHLDRDVYGSARERVEAARATVDPDGLFARASRQA